MLKSSYRKSEGHSAVIFRAQFYRVWRSRQNVLIWSMPRIAPMLCFTTWRQFLEIGDLPQASSEENKLQRRSFDGLLSQRSERVQIRSARYSKAECVAHSKADSIAQELHLYPNSRTKRIIRRIKETLAQEKAEGSCTRPYVQPTPPFRGDRIFARAPVSINSCRPLAWPHFLQDFTSRFRTTAIARESMALKGPSAAQNINKFLVNL